MNKNISSSFSKKTIICVKCPLGCEIETSFTDEEIINMRRAQCKDGQEYARKEIYNPERILIHHVRVKNGEIPLVSVRSNKEIPRSKLFPVIEILNKKSIEAPIFIGDIVLSEPLDLETDIIATKTVRSSS